MKKSPKKLSKNDVQVIGFGSLGLVHVLAMAGVGYWGYKKYSGGGNGLKIVGIIVGACVGISALEIAGLRYRPNSLMKSNLFSSAFKVWRERKDKSS